MAKERVSNKSFGVFCVNRCVQTRAKPRIFNHGVNHAPNHGSAETPVHTKLTLILSGTAPKHPSTSPMIMQMQYLSHDIVWVAAGVIYALPERDRDDGPIACITWYSGSGGGPISLVKKIETGDRSDGSKAGIQGWSWARTMVKRGSWLSVTTGGGGGLGFNHGSNHASNHAKNL